MVKIGRSLIKQKPIIYNMHCLSCDGIDTYWDKDLLAWICRECCEMFYITQDYSPNPTETSSLETLLDPASRPLHDVNYDMIKIVNVQQAKLDALKALLGGM